MKEFKGTPGPWQKLLSNHASVYGDGGQRCIIKSLGENAEDIANATLIAAAPTLLSALNDLTKYFEWAINDPQFKEYVQAKAALSKALD